MLKCAKNHGNWFRHLEDISRCQPSNAVAYFFWPTLYELHSCYVAVCWFTVSLFCVSLWTIKFLIDWLKKCWRCCLSELSSTTVLWQCSCCCCLFFPQFLWPSKGEPAVTSSPLVVFLFFFWKRRESLGLSGTDFYELAVLAVNKPLVSQHQRNLEQWPQPVPWPCPFLIHRQTADRRDIDVYMPAVQCIHVYEMLFTTDITMHLVNVCKVTTTILQPFYGSLDFVRNYLGELAPER